MLAAFSRDNRLLSFSLLCWGMGEGLFIYIEALYLAELGADPVAIGSILAASHTAAALAHMPAGYLADRFGRRPVLVAGWMLGVVTSLGMLLAPNLALYVPARIAYTFTGFVLAPTNAYASEARGSQSVQRALTLVWAGFWAGTIPAPAVGGLIAGWVGTRAVFGGATLLFVASSLAIMRLSPQARILMPAGQRRYGPLFGNRRFLGFLGLIVAALLAMQIGLPFAPNFVVDVRGYDVRVVGALGSVNALGTLLFNLMLGQRLPRRGFMLGQALVAFSLVVLLALPGLPWLFAAYLLRAGWHLSHSMAAAQVSRVVPAAQIGLALGLTETVAAMASILGPLLAGALYASRPALPFQLSLGLILATLPLVWLFAPRRDLHSEAPPLAQPAGSESSLS